MFPGGSVSKSLANLVRPRDALFYGLTGRPFDGREAVRMGLINAAFPTQELHRFVDELAADLAAKDPEAMYATKEGYYLSGEMSWDAAMSYSRAREHELTLRQSDAWRGTAISAFARKEYKPGLGAEAGNGQAVGGQR
jgi:trans-feruloyl-CoA hydratase/vanillin synthase